MSNLVDALFRSSSVELPVLETMDQYLDFIIPKIKPYGEDLAEQAYYVGSPWMEIQDREDFHESILHFFNEGGEYMVSVDGNVYSGAWTLVENSNKIIWERPVGGASQRELYELGFMNADFFILKKHGNQQRKGFKKYFILGREGKVAGLEWKEVMELMFNNYRSESPSITMWVIIVLLLMAIVLIFSFF